MKKLKLYATLFFTMFKIGLFTFGGGYAMITLLEDQFVARKKWIDEKEFMDIVAIAESTPGPVAVNSATYVGYRTAGVLGSVLCTLAVCMPSFIIIYLISLFFNAFIELEYVAYAFEGIQACVIFLILAAGVKMVIKLKKTVFNIIVFAATFAAMILLSLFAVDFSSIYYVLISAAAGFTVYITGYAAKRIKRNAASNGDETNIEIGDKEDIHNPINQITPTGGQDGSADTQSIPAKTCGNDIDGEDKERSAEELSQSSADCRKAPENIPPLCSSENKFASEHSAEDSSAEDNSVEDSPAENSSVARKYDEGANADNAQRKGENKE